MAKSDLAMSIKHKLSFKLGLRGTATLIIVGVTALSLIVTTSLSVVATNKSIRRHYESSLKDAAEALAASCELGLAVGDYEELDRLIRQMMGREHGAFVVVFDAQGEPVSHYETEAGSWDTYLSSDTPSDVFVIVERPVVVQNNGFYGEPTNPDDQRVLGRVLVSEFTRGMHAEQRQHTQRSVLAAVGITLSAGALALLLFQFWIRRLNLLLIASDRVANGDLDHPIKDDHHDEVGRLTRGFEQMRRAVKAQHEQLNGLNETLQQRVDERTLALKHSVALAKGILRSAADGVITIDPQGKIGAFNPAAAEIFGVPAETATGRSLNDLFTDGAEVANDGRMKVRTNHGLIDLGTKAEVSVKHTDGHDVPVQISLAKLPINGRNHLTAIIRDITEQKAAQAEKERMVSELVKASRHAGMAEVASGVLHNVGNVLNSINVSVQCVQEWAESRAFEQLRQGIEILSENKDDFVGFVQNDPRGGHLPAFFTEVGRVIHAEQDQVTQELGVLVNHVEHVKRIIKTQQSYAKTMGVEEEVDLDDLVHDTLRINEQGLKQYDIQVVKELDELPSVVLDKHTCLQILVNLVRNARNAMEGIAGTRRLSIRMRRHETKTDRFLIEIQDTGCGISDENLKKVFGHGFTTRKEGNGFGLHSAALAAQQMGGTLSASSEGEGQGACFALELPFNKPAEEKAEPSLSAA